MKTVLVGLAVMCAGLPVVSQQPAAPAITQTVVVMANSDPVSLAGSDHTVVVLDTAAQPLLFESLPDHVRLDTSLDVQERGPNGVQGDVSIRGGTFSESLILLNGMRIDDPQTGHFNLDVPVPLDAIGRAEVLHGAGSVYYGSDAIAGAVDLITAEPERRAAGDAARISLTARAGYGSFTSTEQHVLGDYARRSWTEQLAGSRDTSSGFVADRNYRSEALSSESWFHSRLGTTDVLLAGSDRPFGANDFYGPYASFEHTKQWLAMLQSEVGERTLVGLNYRRHSDVYILEVTDPALYENNHIDESWQGVVRRSDEFGRGLRLSTGLVGSADTIRSSSLGRHGRNEGAGYASLEARAGSRWTLSMAGRDEIFSGGATNFSPSAAAGYRVSERLRLRASLGHGFRLPSYTDLYYSDPATVGNANLKPETSWSYEGGGTWAPTDSMSVEATGFENRVSNGIDYSKTSPGAKYEATNTGSLAFTGGEMALHLRLAPVAGVMSQQVDLAYTGIHASRSAPPGLISAYVFNYAAQNGSFSWTGRVGSQVVARSQVAVVQRVGQTAYPLWSVALARSMGRVRPYVRFANLSNTGYEELPGIPMPGRSVTGGVALFWSR
jgi:outer membrane cobalamin receptor